MQNERLGPTLQTSVLVHEAYLKLIEVTNVDWQRCPTSSRYRVKSCGTFCWIGPAGA
jgi:hypothetical protein